MIGLKRRYDSDYHVHAHKAGVPYWPMRDILEQNRKSGVNLRSIGYVSHFTDFSELPVTRKVREEISGIISNHEFPETSLYFAIEASLVNTQGYTRELELGIDKEFINEMGFAYVLVGAHWPFQERNSFDEWIADYHEQQVYLAKHPLVDIVAHPWWWAWGGGKAAEWNRSFEKVPIEYHEEFARAAVENGTAVEINFISCLIEDIMPMEIRAPYLKYLDFLNKRGVTFALGSDCRAEIIPAGYEPAWEIMDQLRIDPDRLWHPDQSKTWRRNSPDWKNNFIGRRTVRK